MIADRHGVLRNIPINVQGIAEAIHLHQGRPWDWDVNMNDAPEGIVLLQLFQYINSGIPSEDFFYKGDLYRVHVPMIMRIQDIDPKRAYQTTKAREDGSCHALPITRYDEEDVRGFSKSYDFTHYPKVCSDEEAVFFHCNTGSLYGIDINKLAKDIGCFDQHFEYEQEVLFPIKKEYIIDEHICLPEEFKLMMENNSDQ